MSKTTIYHCDACGKKIGPPYGPLYIQVNSPTEPQCNVTIEVCSFICAAAWLVFNGGSPTWETRKPPIPAPKVTKNKVELTRL